MGYGVLPFAIEKDSSIIFARSSDKTIRIRHVDTSYKNIDIPGGFCLQAIDTVLDELKGVCRIEWYGYILAGIAAVLRLGVKIEGGVDLIMTGDVPLGSGLSSSSSLVCASCLIPVGLADCPPLLDQLVTSVIESERALGINCGGMDQTISLLGVTDCAMSIEFQPQIKLDQVQLSKETVFIIANSCTQSIKSVSAHKHYNMRVVECRYAVEMLCKAKNIDRQSEQIRHLADLQDYLQVDDQGLLIMIDQVLPEGGVGLKELEDMLGTEVGSVVHDLGNYQDVLDNNDRFYLKERAQHVISEHIRVKEFIRLSKQEENEKELGQLMYASHESCKELYDCSCDKLDSIIRIGKENKALGGRLTGAGWGGCAVLMAYKKDADEIMRQLREVFYKDNQMDNEMEMERVDELLFQCQPTQGGMVMRVSQVEWSDC